MNGFQSFISRTSSDLSQTVEQQEVQVTDPAPVADPTTATAQQVSNNLLFSYMQSQNFSQLNQSQALNSINFFAAGQNSQGLPTYLDIYFNAFLGDDNQYHAADSSIGSWQMTMFGENDNPPFGAQVVFGYSAPGVDPLVFVPQMSITALGAGLTPVNYPGTEVATFASLAPVGALLQIADSNPAASHAPQWLPCNGGFYNKVTYQALFNVIKYTYGGGGNTFNVPNIPTTVTNAPWFIRAQLFG